MSNVCAICGKGPITGHNVSHSHHKTKRRWKPNLQTVKAVINGEVKTVKICTKCLKSGKIVKPTIKKIVQPVEEFSEGTPNTETGL